MTNVLRELFSFIISQMENNWGEELSIIMISRVRDIEDLALN